MGSYDRVVYANIARANDGAEPMYSEEALEAFRTGSDPLNFANTDWRKLVLNDWAPQSKHSIRVTGGSQKTSIMFLWDISTRIRFIKTTTTG